MQQPKPAHSGDNFDLYRGDCLKIVPHVWFDHCIGDFPYEETMHAAKAKRRDVRRDGGKMPAALGFASIGDLRPKLLPLVKERCTGWLLAFCTPEGIAPWRDEIEAAGIRYKRACFWYKNDAAPQFNGQGPGYAVEPFVTAWCGRGVSRWNAGGRKNLWECPTQNSDREGTEPTEKPLALMMALIEAFTKPGDLICDPVMGSGSTIIAALATGRRAIGIEKDPKQFKLARARIDSAFTMGRDEGRRHITRKLGRLEKADGLPLFGGADAS